MDISGMIKTPAVRFSVRSDALEERPGQLKAEYQTILQTPALLPIARHKVTGVIGEPARVHNVVNNIILQLAALHSYTDVRLMGLFRETELEQFGWMRWLPAYILARPLTPAAGRGGRGASGGARIPARRIPQQSARPYRRRRASAACVRGAVHRPEDPV